MGYASKSVEFQPQIAEPAHGSNSAGDKAHRTIPGACGGNCP
jgi:hypothetical protein